MKFPHGFLYSCIPGKTPYLDTFHAVSNIRPCQTNSVPQKLRHEQNEIKGKEDQQEKEVGLQKTIIYVTNVKKMFKKIYRLIIISL